MLGAPFLSRAEQLEDAELSLRWALEHAAYAALFPLTVKPHTLLNFAFRHGMYSPVTGPVTAELLRRFNDAMNGKSVKDLPEGKKKKGFMDKLKETFEFEGEES